KKSSVIIICIISIIGILAMIVATKYEYDRYREEYNTVIFEIIGNIKEKYPNISDEKIAVILNGEKNQESINEGKNLLERYGIDSSESAILNMESVYNQSLILNSLIILMLLLLIILVNI